MASESPYVLDNNARQSRQMLDDLSAILDDFTRTRLAREIPAGGRCLEIGAGNGSVAYWLADRVGSGGSVIATDIKPHHIADRPRLSVLKHDVGSMSGLDGTFDLIHARLVLAHLPERRRILRWLAGLLNPGGTILVEEWGETIGRLLVSPRPDAANLYCRYQQALLEVFRAQGNDPGWAMQVADAMTEAGLVSVGTEMSTQSWRGGTPGCNLPIVVSSELRHQLLGAGMSPADLNDLAAIMLDRDTVILGNPTVSTMARAR